MRLALAEDSAILRLALIELLTGRGYDVVIATETGAELLAQLDSTPVDVVIMDVRMPPTFTNEGIKAALTLRKDFPTVGVLVFSAYVETAYATQLFSNHPAGVGYLLKDRVAEVTQFTDAINRIGQGETVLDPQVVSQLIGASGKQNEVSSLTPREREVLELMAQGRTNAGIGSALVLSAGAVEKNISAIFTKLGLEPSAKDHRRVLAVLKYLEVTA
ncbi:response regulator transcription factor [Jonesiaceae bacterium BS-20]|uniref:Response regulator transcription factor n=1 Tax=Jonesiaceae bacterium BS-20 TaxID=3120821 RepID=A0AAU7DXZ3_9MICO